MGANAPFFIFVTDNASNTRYFKGDMTVMRRGVTKVFQAGVFGMFRL